MSFTWENSKYVDWTMQPHNLDQAIDRLWLNWVVLDQLDKYFTKINWAYFVTEHWGSNLTITEQKNENH